MLTGFFTRACFGSVGSVGSVGYDGCDGFALNPAGWVVGREDMDPGAACGSDGEQRGWGQGGNKPWRGGWFSSGREIVS